MSGVPDSLRATVEQLKQEVCALHARLPENNLVAWTAGNVSARVPLTVVAGLPLPEL